MLSGTYRERNYHNENCVFLFLKQHLWPVGVLWKMPNKDNVWFVVRGHSRSHVQTALPGDVGVVPDPCVAEHVGQPLGHQDPDLFHRAAEFQDANVQTRLGALNAVPVEGQFLLDNRGVNRMESSDVV